MMKTTVLTALALATGVAAGAAQAEVDQADEVKAAVKALWQAQHKALTAVCHFNDKKTDQPREFVTNLSAVVLKEGDAWRFHTMHFSHLTAGGDPEPQKVSK